MTKERKAAIYDRELALTRAIWVASSLYFCMMHVRGHFGSVFQIGSQLSP